MDAQLSYSGSWNIFNGSNAVNGTVHFSNTPGNLVTFEFTGTQFVLGYTAHPSMGVIAIRVDGEYMLLNQFNWHLKWGETWESPVYENGFHSVVIEHARGMQVGLDYITIIGDS